MSNEPEKEVVSDIIVIGVDNQGENLMKHFLYAATGTGVLKCTDERDGWQVTRRALEGQQVTSLAAWDHSLLAGTTNGLFCSVDGGEHWEERSQGLSVRHIRSVACHSKRPVKILAGTEPAAIFSSSDCSDTWHESPEVARLRDRHGWYLPYSPEAGCVRGFAFTSEVGYAAVEQGGVLITRDGGVTWAMAKGSTGETDLPESGSGFIHPDVHSIYTHPLLPKWVCAPTGGGLYLSHTFGKKWEKLYRCYCRAMWVDPEDASHIIFGPADGVDRQGRIEETHDGGKTWILATDGLDVPWPHHMVEQFVQVQNQLVGVLSNGELFAAPLDTLEWRKILPEIENVRAVISAPFGD
jgi:photosystem II stability/assembly factor-like uncharacterized protein